MSGVACAEQLRGAGGAAPARFAQMAAFRGRGGPGSGPAFSRRGHSPQPRVGIARRAWLAAAVALAACATPGWGGEPLTLETCIDCALAHSRKLRDLDLSLRGEEQTVLANKARFATGLSANASRSVESDDTAGSVTLSREVPGGLTLSSTVEVSEAAGGERDGEVSVSLSKLILGGGSVLESRLEIENSMLDALAARNAVQRFRRELVYRVKQSYYGVIRGYQTLRISEMRLERAQANLRHAIERENPLDIANARLEVPDVEAEILRQRRAIESALDALKETIGRPVAEDLDVSREFAFVPADVSVSNDLAHCVANHEDFLNAGLELRKAENNLAVQRPRVLPKVTLRGGLERGSEDGADFAAEDDYRLGLSMAWDLGAPAERARLRQARLTVEQRLLAIESLREEAARSLRDLGRRLAETIELVRLQEQRVALNEQRVALYRDRWENGEIDILEYVRSQSDLENSRIQLVNQQTTYMEQLAEYTFRAGR